MIDNVKNILNCCRYCGCKFQQDIRKKIVENKEFVICEFCGIEINIDSIDTQERFVKDPDEKTSNHKDDIKKNKKSIVKRLGKLMKSRKYSVNMILDDEDFPQIFKENLIIVISRLIYFFIREWEQENNISVHRVSLNQSILTYLASKLKPILAKRISRAFLENLHDISTDEFDNLLRLLQKKLESNQDYRTHFLTFLIWLKKIVFKLISDMWTMKNLPKFQATILNDLKEHNFGFFVSKKNNETKPKKSIYEKIEDVFENTSNPENKNYRNNYRVHVEQEELTKIFKFLKEKGCSIKEVNEKIGYNFKNALYKGYLINETSYKKLEELVGHPIPHSIKEPIINPCNLLESEDLAEIIGVLLGDGSISKDCRTLIITLNQIDEPNYVIYVKNLIKSTLKQEPSVIDLTNNKAIQLRIYNNGIINGLLSKGLKSGNKVKNQVNVPLWIKKNHRYMIRCLKGLLDTDGSIFIARKNNEIRINFKNNSKPLVEDFREMCDNLQIRTSKVNSGWTNSRGKKFRHYKVSIGAKDQVAKFLYIINPMKWELRWKLFDNILKRQGSSIEDLFKYKREKKLRYYSQKVIDRINEIP